MKGSITFEFDCEVADQAQTYWRAMIEASRPTTVVSVSNVVIQLQDPHDLPPPSAEAEEEPVQPETVAARPGGWK